MLKISLVLSLLFFAFIYADNTSGTASNEVRELVKTSIQGFDKYSNKVDCMTNAIMDNKIVDRFFLPELLGNPEKFKERLQPYLDDAAVPCRTFVDKLKNIFGF